MGLDSETIYSNSLSTIATTAIAKVRFYYKKKLKEVPILKISRNGGQFVFLYRKWFVETGLCLLQFYR